MDKPVFYLRMAKGTTIISTREEFQVEQVPTDAYDRLKKGSIWLGLTPNAVDFLKERPTEELSLLHELRLKQGFEDDAQIIAKALKKTSKKGS